MAANRSIFWLVVPALTAVSALLLESGVEPGRLLSAYPGPTLKDSDGDLLPDAVEWVLLLDPMSSDSDGDGTDDFLHAVQRRLPLAPSAAYPMDHEIRVVTTSATGPSASREVWLHMLFRFVGTRVTDVTALDPYIDWWGYRLPLQQVLGRSASRVQTLQHPTEGLYLLLSFQLASEETLKRYMPCTIGAVATIGGRTISTGSYLQETAGLATVLVPVTGTNVVVQTLAQDDRENPFWTASRVCVLQLAAVGTSGSGSLYEVIGASCVSDGQLACPPTCLSSNGKIVFFPDGIGTVTGSH